MTIPSNVAVRQAALLLYALPQSDRLWLLRSLPQQQREPLESLLHELKELGIPRQADLLQQALESGNLLIKQLQVNGSTEVAGGVAEEYGVSEQLNLKPWKNLSSDQVGRLARILQHEPPRLLAKLLLISNWSWKESLLARLSQAHRKHAQHEIDRLQSEKAGNVPAKFNQHLLNRLKERVIDVHDINDSILLRPIIDNQNAWLPRILRRAQGWIA